jgi:hypothetical protein
METDEVLVHRVLARDKPAFGVLVDRHSSEAVVARLRSPERFRAAPGRACLREALAEAVTGGRRAATVPKEALMVEVTVEDVIVRSPTAETAVWMAESRASTRHYWRVVLLKGRVGDRVLPIWLRPRAGRDVARGAR